MSEHDDWLRERRHRRRPSAVGAWARHAGRSVA
jgi:hypothetical protein